jgi:hypothetical protein
MRYEKTIMKNNVWNWPRSFIAPYNKLTCGCKLYIGYVNTSELVAQIIWAN